MNDICFDLNGIYLATNTCSEALNDMQSCVFDAYKLSVERMETEMTALSQHYTSEINDIKSKISVVHAQLSHVAEKRRNAEAQKQREIERPPKPAVPDNASPQASNKIMQNYHNKVGEVDAQNHAIRAKNQRISEYCSKCNDAEKKLEFVLAELRRLEERAQQEKAHALSRAKELANHAKEEVSKGEQTLEAMNAFGLALDKVYQAASNIAEMQASAIRHDGYIDKLFVLRNRHSHNSGGHVSFSLSKNTDPSPAYTKSDTDPSNEILIKSCDTEELFEAVRDVYRFRIPCANLHKLGGQAFVAQMETRNFFIKLQPDGTRIDINGMIHWEKKDV